MTALIVAGLLAGLPATLGPLLAVIRHNGGPDEPEHRGADEEYADVIHSMAERRRLADDWPQQITPPYMPELGEPLPLDRPYVEYVARHQYRQEDTVDLTALRRERQCGWMPLEPIDVMATLSEGEPS